MKKTFQAGLFALGLYALAFGCGGEIPNAGDPAAAKPPRIPILMVHGALGFGGAYDDFREWLVSRGHPKSFAEAPDFKWTACLDEFAREIDQRTQELRKKTGAGRIALICHSLGCGAVLSYVNLHGGQRYVSHVITLAGDNHGAYPRPWGLVSCAVRELTPYNSEYVKKMFRNGQTRPGIHYCAFQGTQDFILPDRTTHLEGAKKITVPGAGHASIIFREDVYAAVVNQCLKEKSGGSARRLKRKTG